MTPTQSLIVCAALLTAAPICPADAQEAGAKTPELAFQTGIVRFEPTVRVQIDSRPARGSEQDLDALDVARKRVGVQGRVGRRLSFELEAELQRTSPWRDAYISYRAIDAVRLQAGQFKVPFSLERVTGSTKLDFVNRSLAATVLAPRREQGAMVHGRVLRRIVRYEAGVFRHDRRATFDGPDAPTSGRTAALRVTAQPFAAVKSVWSDLQAGMAVTHGEIRPGLATLRGRTALGERFLPSASYWVAGSRRRTGLEARWRPGPFSAAGEYMRQTDERRAQAVDGSDLSPLVGSGWHVSGTWVVTGESKKKLDDGPRSPLFHGGIGAIEIGARLERLAFGSAGLGSPSTHSRADRLARRSDRALTLGVNWLPHRLVKVQANLVRDAAETEGISPPRAAWGQVFRLQLSL